MKYLLFDSDTRKYLDGFDEIEDWGFVTETTRTGDITLVYRQSHNDNWTNTMYGHRKDLDCIMCDGKLKQKGGSNYSRFRKDDYECEQCKVTMEIVWDKHNMKNRVTPYVERPPTEDQYDTQPVDNGVGRE